MAFNDSWIMSFNDLQTLIDTEGFTQNNPFTAINETATKLEVIDAINIDASYLSSVADNQMVPRALIYKPGVVVPVHKQYHYDGAYTSSSEDTLCLVTASVWYAAYYEGTGDLPVSGDVAYSGVNDTTPMNGDGLYRILRDPNSDTSRNISVASNGTITVYNCVEPELGTPFPMVVYGFLSASQACSDNSLDTKDYYHNGAGALPAYGDIISDETGAPVAAGYFKDISDTRAWVRQTNSNGEYILGQYC